MLVIGVLAAIMALDIGKTLKAFFLVAIFLLAVVENRAIDRDRADAASREAQLWGLAQQTVGTATQTLTNVSILGIRVENLQGEIRDAENKKDTVLVQRLQKEKLAEEGKIVLTTLSGISVELVNLGTQWQTEDQRLINENSSKVGKLRNLLSYNYSRQIQPLVSSADLLRQQVFKLWPSLRSVEDQNQTVVFSKVAAGERIQPGDLISLGNYLADLYRRAAAISPQ
ncbi:MAG TPA: hypothetical protein VMG82_00375 [Candidatus Sulfotelmatobacter sp.]|nr:hypothetical protein [Candidatus Sulfotelmatobacter sp.]